MRSRQAGGVSWIEDELPGARVVFGTRAGGVSGGPFASLNLSLATGDAAEHVAVNRRRFAEAAGAEPDRLVSAAQVHGTTLAHWPSHDTTASAGAIEADGHIVTDGQVVPLVFVADCLPVALSGPAGLGLLHCGWRGIAAGLPALGAQAVGATSASIGPGIGPCCFQAGPEVVSRFEALGNAVIRGDHIDLASAVERSLRQAGVGDVRRAQICTSCASGQFFSHRRDQGVTGRQGALLIPCPS